MVVSEHPDFTQGRRWLTSTEVIDPVKEYKDRTVDDDVDDPDEYDQSGLGEMGVVTDVDGSETKEVQEAHKTMKVT